MDKIIIDFFKGLGDWGNVLLISIELIIATLLSGAIGYEREYHGHAAGLRTHILVSLGACLIMIISIQAPGLASETRDPARIAAQVVSGIGFLGAGTIIQTGTDIKGLTTAATIWLVGAIGLACGSGFFSGALITTIISILILVWLTKVERHVNRKAPRIVFTIPGEKPVLKEALVLANKYGLTIKDVTSTIIKEKNGVECLRIIISLSYAPRTSINAFGEEIRTILKPFELKIYNS